MVNYKNKKKNVIIDKLSRFFSVIGFCFCFLCNSKYDDDDDENYKENELREPMAKIRLGFKGKDTWINSEGINIHQMFGKYSVLLDNDDKIVPLTKDGELFEPLDCRKSYKVVANYFGTTGNAQKWKELKRKELNDRKQFNLFKKQFKTSQQLKQKEQLDQYYSNSNNNQELINDSGNNNNNNSFNNSILDDNYHQVDIFINDNSNNSLINNDSIYINNNINNNINNSNSDYNQKSDNNYSFIEFVNNDNDNNNDVNNSNIINNIKKDFNINNKFYT